MTSFRRRSILYFPEEGKRNWPHTFKAVISRARSKDISAVVVFTADGNAAIELKKALPRRKSVIAVTFPAHQTFLGPDGQQFSHVLSELHARQRLISSGIPVVIGALPFQEVIIPNVEDPKLAGITRALSLLGGSFSLCVQAVTMATDSGHVDVGEKVIACTSDTALVIRSSSASLLFHPVKGMQIQEILCKPSVLTITRKRRLESQT